MNLGLIRKAEGDIAEAEALLRDAVEVLAATCEPDHPNLVSARRALERVRSAGA